ncbi:hypothetical protein KP509_05G013700 [Ceratopteris richardii]|uniref:Plant heme peroxidase family profile domain-containing protein n=1 Tax=Ceratopteris richardii TaxID=49495 RepID=A0A8T2UJH2_CERRI|nr:hypothetical protein KP509_05G013700 [Ceratopteris richardii]
MAGLGMRAVRLLLASITIVCLLQAFAQPIVPALSLLTSGPNFNITDLVASFAAVGLSAKDMVALSGAHTIGKACCDTFLTRLTADADDPTALAAGYREFLSAQCSTGPATDVMIDLDVTTPVRFDNAYFSNLQQNLGLLHSDQVLYATAGSTRQQVTLYAHHQSAFFQDFAAAMIHMGNISPLTGSAQGEVRKVCGFVNA